MILFFSVWQKGILSISLKTHQETFYSSMTSGDQTSLHPQVTNRTGPWQHCHFGHRLFHHDNICTSWQIALVQDGWAPRTTRPEIEDGERAAPLLLLLSPLPVSPQPSHSRKARKKSSGGAGSLLISPFRLPSSSRRASGEHFNLQFCHHSWNFVKSKGSF